MDIKQNTDYQKHSIALSQFTMQKHLAGNTPKEQQTADTKTPTDRLPGASEVSLSQKGRAASFKFDFYATADNLSKMDTLRNSESFTRAHTSISYANIKNLLD